ncbi:MAG: glycosyltransferase family 2 protein [Bacteroidota bacterium]
MEKLSVVIITYNEEKNIARCLESVKGIADEIVIVDSASTDATVAICEKMGAKVIQQPFLGYTEQKNFAVAQASYPFVFSIDADEAPNEKLLLSIIAAKKNPSANGYSMNRLTNYCGSWVKHCGWYPDRKLRLFFKEKGAWTGGALHEKYELNSNETPMLIDGDLLHYSYYSIDDHIKQVDKFTAISSKELAEKGYCPSLLKLISAAPVKFFRDYIIKLGFLDGYTGFQISKMSAFATYLKYARARDLYRINHHK